MSQPIAMFSPCWVAAIATDLRAGYGVEDIAIRLGCHPAAIRREVASLRASGALAAPDWWGHK